MRIFVAGATGVIGRGLIPRLSGSGHQVTGLTRTLAGADLVRSLGAEPAMADAFDASGVIAAVIAAKPEVIVHQLTSLPDKIDPASWAETLERNSRIRIEGTRNLVEAAVQAGARRLVAQSIAWVYAAGPLPHDESSPLDVNAEGTRAITVKGVGELERQVLSTPVIEGVVLRFGYLYGPHTWYQNRTGEVSLHVDAAVEAVALAVTKGSPGIYNVLDDDGTASNRLARRVLGWNPDYRRRDNGAHFNENLISN